MKIAIVGASNQLKKKVKAFISDLGVKCSRKPLHVRELSACYYDCALLRSKSVFVNPVIQKDIAIKQLDHIKERKIHVIYIWSSSKYRRGVMLNEQAKLNKDYIALSVSELELQSETAMGWSKIKTYVQKLQ
jgi:hypothetical protein